MTHPIRFCERGVCWLLLAALLVLTAYHTLRAFDHSRDEYEGAMIPVTERQRGGLPGPDWLTALPYTVTPYGPGFFALAGTASVGPWQGTLIPGRLVSVAAAVLTAVVIAVVVGRRSASAACGLAAGVLYLGYPIIAYWFHDYRVDALACFFAIAAYAAPDLPWRGLLASALLVVVGSVVKQTVALAAVPVFVHLLYVGRRRDALLYFSGVAVLGGVTWAVLFYLSQGYYFDLGLWGNRRAYILHKAMDSAGFFIQNPATIAAAVALIAAFAARSKPICSNRYVIALMISLVFGGLLSGGEGSANNYFLESAGLVCVVVGIYGIDALWRSDQGRTAVVLCIAGFAVIARRECEHRPLRSSRRKSRRSSLREKPGGHGVRTGGSAICCAGALGRIDARGERSLFLRRGRQESRGRRRPAGRGHEGRSGERVGIGQAVGTIHSGRKPMAAGNRRCDAFPLRAGPASRRGLLVSLCSASGARRRRRLTPRRSRRQPVGRGGEIAARILERDGMSRRRQRPEQVSVGGGDRSR